MRFAIEQRYRTVTGDDLKRTFEVKRRFALLAVEVEGTEFHFTKSAEEFEGGGLDIVFFGDFDEGGVNICIVGECTHEDTGGLRVDVG